ncbi:MAG: DUF2283 domain-containing protein, partial [Candidatus Diapherotrites archaeon]|nr:DUF2283 domain-containing protein [Candidatus Diapherotrites archaeon]
MLFESDYDFQEDLLYLYNKSKKSKGSIELGELIIDLEKKGEIVGLEIFNASKYLSNLTNKKITKSDLKKIKPPVISFTPLNGVILIKLIFSIEKEKILATIAIQNMNYSS